MSVKGTDFIVLSAEVVVETLGFKQITKEKQVESEVKGYRNNTNKRKRI